MEKIIFITGASKGFGKLWAAAFLKRGDKVVATARNLDALKDLVEQYGDAILALPLDVNNRTACFEAVKKAQQHFGRIDILINNAGYGLFGMIEEASEQEAREQIETNLFGLLWITQAVIPVMRNQGSGHILQISSVLGLAAVPRLGIYTASKWAVEGLSESLAAEVKPFGIKMTIVEPNSFATEWAGSSASRSNTLKEYDQLREAASNAITPDMVGVPEATVDAILQLVDASSPPLRLFLGKVGYPWIRQVYQDRLATWEQWQPVAAAAHGK